MSTTTVIAGFPITPEVTLRKRISHHDVPVEVSNHGRSTYSLTYGEQDGAPGTWCYYVSVYEDMLPPEQFAEFWLEPKHSEFAGKVRKSYDYYAARFAGADWHGGVTFYEKHGGIDGDQRYVKIGCDFAHLYDEGCSYDYQGVEAEAKATVDALREMYSFYRRCPWNGLWQPESEMVEHKGKLYSVSGKASMDAYATKDAEVSNG